MAAEWFCEIEGRLYGPLSSEQLKSLADQGQIRPEHNVRQGAQGLWVPAGRVRGLFPATEPTAVSPRLPPPSFAPASPPATSSSASPRTATSRRHRRQQKEFLFVISLLIAIGALAIVGIVIMVSFGSAGPQGGSGLQVSSNKPMATAETDDLENFDLPTPKRSAEGQTQTSSARAPSDTAWTDASTGAIERGPVRVRIVSARLGTVPLARRADGNAPSDSLLIVDLQLENTHAQRKVEFSRWSGSRVLPGVRLSDNIGNTYKPKLVVRANQSSSVSIYPGRSVNDQLVFESPVDAAEYLHLELPASPLAEREALHFKIPRTMVTMEEPSSEPADPPQPAPTAGSRPPNAERRKPGTDTEPVEGGVPEINRGIEEIQAESERAADADRPDDTTPANDGSETPSRLDLRHDFPEFRDRHAPPADDTPDSSGTPASGSRAGAREPRPAGSDR